MERRLLCSPNLNGAFSTLRLQVQHEQMVHFGVFGPSSLFLFYFAFSSIVKAVSSPLLFHPSSLRVSPLPPTDHYRQAGFTLSTLLSKPSTLARNPLTISRICLTLSNSVSSSSIWRIISLTRAISASAAAREEAAR